MNDLNAARLEKQLDKLYNLDGRIMTLRDLLNDPLFTRVTEYKQDCAEHRTHLEYKQLTAPKIIYTAWVMLNGREVGYNIPKLVYDYMRS